MPARHMEKYRNNQIIDDIVSPEINSFVDLLANPTLVLDEQGTVILRNAAFTHIFAQHCLIKDNYEVLTLSIQRALAEAKLTSLFPIQDHYQQETLYFIDAKGQKHKLHIVAGLTPKYALAMFESNQKEELLKSVLDCIPGGVFWKDRQSKYLGVNHRFLSDLGLEKQEEICGKSDYDLFPSEAAQAFQKDDQEVMKQAKPKLNIEESIQKTNGDEDWLLTNKVPILNNHEEVIGVMGSYTNITDRKNYQKLIEKQALYDQLTGLYNRQSLQKYFANLEKNNTIKIGGLLFIDLDNFKTVNDTLGHAVGDELLKFVSQRILKAGEEHDFIARLGGDEFAVVTSIDLDRNLTENRENERQKTRHKINQLARKIKNNILKPYEVGSHYIQLGVSIGITYFDSHLIDWTNTFNEADMAMYDAKFSGRNRIRVFNENIRQNTNHVHRIRALLNQSIEKEELYLNIQPQYGRSGNIIGAEALLRWNNNELGEISPMEFIPISEQSGTIHSIGLWVFEQAFKLVFDWVKILNVEKIPPLAVNVSAKQFQSNDFLSSVQALLQKYPIDTKLIHFELTESLLVENKDNAIEKLKALADLGFPLAIDDFGTGYSCLSYLNQLPIDKIKIDKSFTFKINQDKKQSALVETIISMAKNLDMNVIAEGVETQEQLQFLKRHGCYEYQGYYFSKPINVQAYQNLLRKEIIDK